MSNTKNKELEADREDNLTLSLCPLLRNENGSGGILSRLRTTVGGWKSSVKRWSDSGDVYRCHTGTQMTHFYDTLIRTAKQGRGSLPNGKERDEVDEVVEMLIRCKEACIRSQK